MTRVNTDWVRTEDDTAPDGFSRANVHPLGAGILVDCPDA
jgi:hypothetical protein